MAVHFDRLLEDGAVVRVPLGQSQEPKSPLSLFFKEGEFMVKLCSTRATVGKMVE